MSNSLMPAGPISGPSAWYGPDMAARDEWIFRLEEQDLAELDVAIKDFSKRGLPLADISPSSFVLPTLGSKLRSVLYDLLEGRGFVLLRGFDPSRYSREQVAIAYMGVGSYFGRPRSQNAKGHLLGHVKDLGLDIANQNVRYYQTSRRLNFHTDSVDIVALLCLNAAKAGGESYIVSSVTCFNEMLSRRPDLAALLFEPYPTDRRGEVPEGMLGWFELPVFSWFEERLSCIYSREYIESAQDNFPEVRRLTPAQREAVDMLTALANDAAIRLSMAFTPGDMQFLHNHQILHSRGEFENWSDPKRHRHLLRLWICPPNGRALPEAFALRYGSVVPGDRGGIVVKGMKLKVPLDPE